MLMKKLLFVYNPHSGKGTISQSLSDIICILTEGGYDVTVHPTTEKSDGENYIAKNAEFYDIVVTSGGDGMLHEMFSGLDKSGKPIRCGYIPSGTVNDFASSLGISRTPSEAAATITDGRFRKLDVGVFNGQIFSYVAAFGMFTKVSYATDQKMKNAFGAAAYFIEVLKSLDPKVMRDSTVHAAITIGENRYEDDFVFGMAGNTLSVGTLKSIVPHSASMDDGLLEGVFIKEPKSLADLDRIRGALMSGDLDIPEIIYASAPSFKISLDRETEWTLDGEYGGSCTEALINVKEKAVEIAVP